MLQILAIVLLASIVRFAIGGIWYMPTSLLGKVWAKSQDLAPEEANKMMSLKATTSRVALTSSFALTFVSTFIFALILTPLAQMSERMAISPIVPALILVGLIWLGFIVPVLAQRKVYTMRTGYTWKTFFIDASHEFVALAICAVILISFM